MLSRRSACCRFLIVLLSASAAVSVARAETTLVQDFFNDESRQNTPADLLDRSWISYHPDEATGGKPFTVATHNAGAIEGSALKFSGPSTHAYGVATFPTVSLATSGNYIELGFDFALGSAAGPHVDNTGPKLGLFYNNRTPLTTDNPPLATTPTKDDRGYLLNFQRNFDGKLLLRYEDRLARSFHGGVTVGTWDPQQLPDTSTHHLTVRFTLASGGGSIIAVPTLDGFTGSPVTLSGTQVIRSFNEVVVSTFTNGTTGYIDNIYVTTKVLERTFYYTTPGDANEFGHGAFSWDGSKVTVNTASLGRLPANTINGSNKIGADGFIYSGRSGSVFQMNPVRGTFNGANSGVNGNTVTSISPNRMTVFVGGSDSNLATLKTGAAFGDGTVHDVTGDDGLASGLAWDASGKAWYTTGGENPGELGNVGKIDLSTYKTKRLLTGISATSMTFDPYTGDLFAAGTDGIAQIDPVTATVVSTWKNPNGLGNFIPNIEATGTGQLVAMDTNGFVRLWDFTNSVGLIGDPTTLESAAETTGVNGGLSLADVVGLPAITSPLKATAFNGQRFTYQFEATNATSLAVNNLPTGLTFDPALSAIVGKATVNGTYKLLLQATNAFGTTNATLVITVRAASGLAIISSTSATGRTGKPFSYQMISKGASPTAKANATGLPPGLTFEATDGVISGIPTVDGSSLVTLSVIDGNTTAAGTLQLTFSSDPGLPVITSASSATLAPGQSFSYKIVAPAVTNPSDETKFTLLGTLPAGLNFDTGTGTIGGSFTPPRRDPPGGGGGEPLSGGVITNVQLFATNSNGTATLPLIFYLAPKGVVNIATRLLVGTGDNVLITGFILTGNAPKKVILRGLGPSLKVGDSPLPGRLQDPVLEIYQGSTLLGSNDNWRSDQEDEILETGIPPSDDRESAAVAILAAPGAYTAHVVGKNNTTGVGVVELYDLGTASLDTSSNSQLVNLSTRGLVQTGDNILIGGFIVSAEPTKVIVRAIGPSLSGVSGALQDPTLSLFDGNGTVVKANDNWRTGGQEQAIIDTTVPPSDDRESAVVATLIPGGYTAVVRGTNNTTGIAVVELYALQP